MCCSRRGTYNEHRLRRVHVLMLWVCIPTCGLFAHGAPKSSLPTSCAAGHPIELGLCAHTDVERYVGPVHTVHLERSGISPSGAKVRNTVFDATFDPQGNTIETVSYKPDGSVYQKLEWEYRYDDRGRILELRYLNSGQLTNTGIYTYPANEAEDKIELVQVNPDGSVNHKAIFLYDKAGNRVAESRDYPGPGSYPPHGTFYVTMRYDERGNQTERREFNSAGSLTGRSEWKRDWFGNTTAYDRFNSEGKLMETGRVNRRLECDAHGNVIRAVNMNRNGSVKNTETITYEYDSHGNWTQKTTVREYGGKKKITTTDIVEKTITYY